MIALSHWLPDAVVAKIWKLDFEVAFVSIVGNEDMIVEERTQMVCLDEAAVQMSRDTTNRNSN